MTASSPIPLRAGPLRLLFDNGMVRSVYYGDIEIVRRVYMALRDQYWNTIPYTLGNLSIRSEESSFRISFDARHFFAGIDFSWKGTIDGTAGGVVAISMDGEAKCGFLRNRIGWCILHPLTLCKGAPCTLDKYVGSVENARFPGNAIAPFEPFVGLRGMTYAVVPGVDCELRFTGDIFETEDQRNWTDASFKTYSTPHSLPIPVEVASGQRIGQQVTISVPGAAGAPLTATPATVMDFETSFAAHEEPLRIGVGYCFESPLPQAATGNLALLGLSHLRFDVDPRRDDLDAELSRAASVCERAECEAEMALRLSADFEEELAGLPADLRACDVPLCRVLVLRNDVTIPPPETVKAAIRHLSTFVDEEHILLATDRHFIEINRALPLPGPVGGICFAATPQVHTFDDRAVMENIEGLWECISFARTAAGGKPVALSPLTLRPRVDSLRPHKNGGADERQRELFGAAWLAGVLCAALQAGLHSCTFFRCAAGPEGIMSEDGNELFPLYHVLASGITEAASASGCILTGRAAIIAAARFQMVSGWVLLAANLSHAATTLNIGGLPPTGTLGLLDATTEALARRETAFWEKVSRPFDKAGRESFTLELPPYAVARIELPR